MRIDRVRLRDFKCYGEVDVPVDSGVTVIYGPNGSGKSSLLEACFFALYGSKALEGNLEDVIRNGADDTEVEVWFAHGGRDYHVRRRVRGTSERAQTATCVLETPDDTVEGARDVRRVVADLLRMDADAFVNCAYVRQGEVNKLINARPTDRQAMLDDLLQLGQLEDYRERAGQGRLAVQSLLDRWADRLEDREGQIEALEERDLHDGLNELETQRARVDEEIENFEKNRERARKTLADAVATLEKYEERREELTEAEDRIDLLTDRVAETETEREELAAEITEKREAIEDAEATVSELLAETDLDAADPEAVEERRTVIDERRESLIDGRDGVIADLQEHRQVAERNDERSEELSERAEEKREAAEELESEVAEVSDEVSAIRDRIEEIAGEIENRRAVFEDAPIEFGEADTHLQSLQETRSDLREREAEVRERLATARSRVEEAEKLLAQGKCPECGQTVEGSPHVESVDEYREAVEGLEEDLTRVEEERDELDERIERTESLSEAGSEVADLKSRRELAEERLTDRETEIEEKQERAEGLREEADEIVSRAGEAEEAAETARERASEKQAELGELNRRQGELKERLEHLDDLADTIDNVDELDTEVERLRDRRTELADRNDERRETLASTRERKRELESAVDEDRVEQAHEEKERAEEYVERVDGELDSLADRRDDLQSRIGAIERDIETLEELREEREAMAERVDVLTTLQGEAETLEVLYGDLRAELRHQNIASLERLLNETFDLVYGNDAYAHIELDPNYELTVYQKNGEALDPGQLSGGERALFNLALRTAIYRLLAEGIEGAAPMPPLILDEPTVFLDSGHVTRLVDLVESMRELGVEQIVVVSHDEELVGAADDLLTVEKDPTTNRSSVSRDQSLGSEIDVVAD